MKYMEAKVYRKDYVDVKIVLPDHKEYVVINNLENLLPDSVVIPIEQINKVIRRLITIKIELEKYE